MLVSYLPNRLLLEIPQKDDYFADIKAAEYTEASRPALGPTQPPVQWEPGLSRG
jgi:hypothetical protein